MRVFITGSQGLLGAAILREFHDADVHPFDHSQLDVADENAVNAAVEGVRPDVSINCAAYNNVDRAEQESEAALRVNALALLALARAARRVSATLVHYSTDFVFDGEADRPYTEEDLPTRAVCTRPRSCLATGSPVMRRTPMCCV
jgi:dTDP-4-dehydrorhamnose reductase